MSVDEPDSGGPILDGTGHVAVDLKCLNCGYNLRTQPVTGRCPECGHPVAETTAGYLPQLDGEGCVAIDLPCIKCAYNLRTLPATGLCPECGAPVAPSVRGRYLHFAPPRWVRRLARGAAQLIVGVLCSIGFGIVASQGFFIFGFAGARAIPGGEIALALFIVVASAVCVWLLVSGLWRLTAPDPTGRFPTEGLSARKLVRYSLLALAALIALGLVLAAWTLSGPVGRPLFRVFWFPFLRLSGVFLITPVAIFVVWFLLVPALVRHIIALMRRIPRPGLVASATIEFWAILASAILFAAGYGFVVFISFRTLAAMTMGPNMPVPPYAAGPNAPSGVATTSAPAPSSSAYTSTATIEIETPGGVTVGTTMPASAPLVMTPSPFGPLFFLASIAGMVGGCGSLGTFIAGIVLLILVRRALANAARLAELHAGPALTANSGGTADAARE
jgi:endogenous inhibitor of DNA gyrase (YacG/DUF329 family)